MKPIDLVPPDEARAAAARRRARRHVRLGVAVTVVLVASAHAGLAVAARRTRERLAAADAELAALRRPVALLRRLRQRQDALARRIRLIDALEARGGQPALLLETIAAAAPGALWLTELELADGRVRLAGGAVDDGAIADFVGGLRAAAPLAAVDLVEAAAEGRGRGASRRFVIAGRLAEVP